MLTRFSEVASATIVTDIRMTSFIEEVICFLKLRAIRWVFIIVNITCKTRSSIELIMKNKKYHTVSTVPKSNTKVVETGNVDILSTQIHDHELPWLGTGTSIESGGFKLVLRLTLYHTDVWGSTILSLLICLIIYDNHNIHHIDIFYLKMIHISCH